MKLLLASLVVVIALGAQINFAQVKFDEYTRLGTDDQSARIDAFANELFRKPESRGMVVVYAESGTYLFGNLSSYLKGLKQYLLFRGIDSERLSIDVRSGKRSIELWIYPPDVALPESISLEFDMEWLEKPFLYGEALFDGGGAVPLLSENWVDFEHYAELLKTNRSLKGLIQITQGSYPGISKKESYQEAIWATLEFRKTLIDELKVPASRFKIQIKKPTKKHEGSVNAKFYLIQNK